LRRQLSIDKNKRHRGSDAPDAPLLLELDGAGGEGDVVIGRQQSNQRNHEAAQGLDPTRAVETQEAW
jgi:hypothetical protein